MGHYVRRRDNSDGSVQMLRGVDGNKDQSYFLYTLSHEQVARSLFPVGELEKHEVREIAKKMGLITHDKKDSTGICFIGERKFTDFLATYLPAQPGNIETPEGEIIGKHQGLMYHTLGQRKGLGIGGLKDSNEDPWYVVEKDLLRNVLIVGQGGNHPRLMSSGMTVNQLDWVDRKGPMDNSKLAVKTRYRQADVACTLIYNDDASITVTFDEPVAAVTPGQSAVFYDGEICLGGGIIDSLLRG
jgi:tRNA-specific 2-thiouridylase